jgi:hypothetical protein
MTPSRLVAIAAIYAVATLASFTLGTSVIERSGEFDNRLAGEVARLWGGRHVRLAPAIAVERPGSITENKVTRTVQELTPIAIEASRIDAHLALGHRKKGLLWYDTYGISFKATYRVTNPDTTSRTIVATLIFPTQDAQFDNFALRLNGVDAPRSNDLSQGVSVRADVGGGGPIIVELNYDSRGLDTWTYAFAGEGITQVKDLLSL